jgi:hypothetical protein
MISRDRELEARKQRQSESARDGSVPYAYVADDVDTKTRPPLSANACQIPSDKEREVAPESSLIYHHAPSITFTHDTALKSNHSLFDLDENGELLTSSTHAMEAYNYPAVTHPDPRSFLQANLNAASAYPTEAPQIAQPSSSSSALLAILDPSYGDYSRKVDEKASVKLQQQKVIREGLERFPKLPPLSHDSALDLKKYQKNAER